MRLNEKLTQVEDAAANLLQLMNFESIERSVIEDKVRAIALIQGSYSDQEIQLITRKLEERFNIKMSLGIIFSDDQYQPWLDDEKGEIEWYYWNRYKRYINNQKLPPQIIRSLDSITDQILDHLENPKKEVQWTRKGMVVGHVQSGKTGNYIGLINKAADSGYKVIIVLAGTLNSLRNQTQSRIDMGFIGINTESKTPDGVGLFDSGKNPAFFTTCNKDFRKATANSLGVSIEQITDPVILVIKKNKSTLENLIDWLKHNNRHNLKSYPTLVIDDEADHASINTSKEGDVATTINRKIRELLHLFDRSSYVGYTATPFANVFIDPENETEMLGDDLFPRDFIISLDPPTNYIGSERVFSSNSDLDIVRVADDYEDYLPLKHKKDLQIDDIPESLKNAVIVFILVRAIRMLRGQKLVHNSMLINVSRFTAVQSDVKLLVDEYLKRIHQSISNHYRLRENEALKNSFIFKMKNVFDKEFLHSGYTWHEIQLVLKASVSSIAVIEINSSSGAEPLDYDLNNYPSGRNIIAVGGMSLSRGLTLEGLSVSYFLRNSVMYDTLMQMGRWFGYRDGYADLCRIYMTAEAASWYAHISDVIDELRDEFKRMKAAGMSPKDFGLCVRSHPESLIVTARNKMRSGISVARQVSLEGRLVETSVLLKTSEALDSNRNLLKRIVKEMQGVVKPEENKNSIKQFRIPSGYLWREIPVNIIINFIKNFQNHPASQLTEQSPLINFLNRLELDGLKSWDVVLISPDKKVSGDMIVCDLVVNLQTRSVSKFGDKGIAINKEKRRVGYAVQESAGLPLKEVQIVEKQYKLENPEKKSIPGSVYRKLREQLNWNPLLILHVLNCEEEKGSQLFTDGVIAYGISFPGEPGSRRPQKLVEYIVNTVWWKNEYLDLLDDEEESYGE